MHTHTSSVINLHIYTQSIYTHTSNHTFPTSYPYLLPSCANTDLYACTSIHGHSCIASLTHWCMPHLNPPVSTYAFVSYWHSTCTGTFAVLPIGNHHVVLQSSELNSSLKGHLTRNITQRPFSYVELLFPLFLSHTSFEVGIRSFQDIYLIYIYIYESVHSFKARGSPFSSFILGHTTND